MNYWHLHLARLITGHIMSWIMQDVPIRGALKNGRVRVTDSTSTAKLGQDGYGDKDPDGYHLRSFEALYLIYAGKLVLEDNITEFGRLLEVFRKDDPDIFSKYLIYRDLRSRGYVAKNGFGFEMDFRVYDRGDFGIRGTKLLVFGLNEGRKERAGTFCRKVDKMAAMGKEPVVAVIDRRGEIIYYKMNRIRFAPNN